MDTVNNKGSNTLAHISLKGVCFSVSARINYSSLPLQLFCGLFISAPAYKDCALGAKAQLQPNASKV